MVVVVRGGETGFRWFQGLRDAVASLAHSPERCALAPENAAFPLVVSRDALLRNSKRLPRVTLGAWQNVKT